MKWSHIILEGFCGRKWSISKDKYLYRHEGTDKPLKKIPNPKYDPNYKTPRKPSYCKNKICYTCYERDCPHLATTNAGDDDYKLFFESWEKKHK